MAEDAGTLWTEMKNLNNSTIGMTHDGYLKLYQLSSPRLHQYDIILIDEAQDLTPGKIELLTMRASFRKMYSFILNVT